MFRTTLVTIALLGIAAPACRGQVRASADAIEEPSKLRSAIRARTDDFSTARFKEVVLEYFGEKERVKVRQLILVEQPRSVRVQTRAPGSNEIVNLLVTDGESFALHRRRSNRYVTGPPTRANINRLLPVDLSARDIVRVMFGGAPWDRFDSAPGDPSLDWNGDKGSYEYSVAARKHDPTRRAGG